MEEGHLYGGKIVAALDRQHPRDLFDVKYMLKTVGFSPKIKKGFIFYLISSNRPIGEIIFPNLQDQKLAFGNQFVGMTNEFFEYADYEHTRLALIKAVHSSLTKADMAFLLSIEKGQPDWSIYDFSQFPAVQWKLQNLQNLKAGNPDKHKRMCELLELNFLERGKK